MKTIMAFLCTLCSVYAFASSTTMDLSDYDLDNRIEFDQFTFLPIKGSSIQGAFVYSTYAKELLGPTAIGYGWKSVVLSVKPRAIETDIYDDFIIANNIIDRRENLIPPDASLCNLTDSAEKALQSVRAIYSTRVIVGGYPKACSLTIRYFLYPQGPSEETLLAMLSAEGVVSLEYSLSSEPTLVATVKFHDIIRALAELGVLTETQPDEFEGLAEDVLSQGMLLDPALFGDEETIPVVAWELFLSGLVNEDDLVRVSLSEANVVLTLEEPSVHLVTVDEEL